MAFKNCMLDESEGRVYELRYPYTGEKVNYECGTFDLENDIRLVCYANGSIMEPSDIYSFIYDYKGSIFYLNFRQELKNNDVYWYLESSVSYMSEDQIEKLREAMKVYGYWGFNLEEWLELRDDPTFVSINEKGNIYIEF